MMINGYYPRIGGAERQLGFLAPRLQSKGTDIYVLTRRYPGLSPFEEVEGVPVHRLPVPGPKPVASLLHINCPKTSQKNRTRHSSRP